MKLSKSYLAALVLQVCFLDFYLIEVYGLNAIQVCASVTFIFHAVTKKNMAMGPRRLRKDFGQCLYVLLCYFPLHMRW